jgi:lysophospholipase L1-like esterase
MAPMADPVPKLAPRPLSRTMRLLSVVHPGIRAITAQIGPYTAWWDEQNRQAATASGPLLVAVGDSTAIGIGASAPQRGYVGLLQQRLNQPGTGHQPATANQPATTNQEAAPWRVVNLALSGARVDDALERQLPALAGLEPDLVVCCIGTNDVVWGRETGRLREQLRNLVGRLPDRTLIGALAGGSARARLANRALRGAAGERGMTLVNPWAEPTPPGLQRLASDRFHPSDVGYELMAIPFYRALGLPAGGAGSHPSGPAGH